MLNEAGKKKVAQIIHCILSVRGRSEGYTKLLKLLYLIDTSAMRHWHMTVTNDDHYALMNGPVLMDTHDILRAIEDGHLADSVFRQYVDRTSKDSLVHQAIEQVDYDELSEAELDLIRDVVRRYGHKNTDQLIEMTHKFDEWKVTKGSRMRLTVPMIAEAIARSKCEMRDIIDGVQAHKELDALWDD